jgi:hypothetical protein
MWAQNNSDVASQWSYTMMNTQNNTAASSWGWNMDITKMTNDPAAQLALLQNVMFTRLAMASNDKFITPQGGFNPNLAAGMAVPMDPLKVSGASSNGTGASPSSGSGSGASAPTGSSTSSSAPSASSSTSGARRTIASSATAVFAAVAIAALVL